MRSFRILLIVIALLVCLHTVTAGPLVRRQDEPTSASARPSSTSRPRESSVSQSASDHQSTTEESTPRTSVAATSTTVSASPSATSVLANGTDLGNVSSDPLPLHPKITPALGLIGALLLISGTVYAVVGIKNKWIYVFGSAAYLAALAVVVLIVYLMNTPVSKGVQGAFFVASFLTGILFGGLALIFTDLTEGLGCLLGGFCVSMWFLSLKEGGLITSTTGRAIFIGCMSVAGYSLSFSHYTRTYGLIGSISFSGATITMLGVDCFSRAGWKEFWLYHWNLNPDVFPLNTTTYPLTKGIRVELAGVVVLCVFAIVSQLRLWRIIKERRTKREEDEQQKAQSQQIHETELGRDIEDKFQRERREWEATYGEKDLPGSSDKSGSTTPQSPSLTEKDYPATAHDSKVDLAESEKKQAVVAVISVQDDEIQQIDGTGKPIVQDGLPAPSGDISRSNSTRPSSEAVASSRMSRTVSVISSLQSSPPPPPPPVVVPLPFRIPQEEDARSQTSDNASVSALPDTEEKAPEADEQSVSRRVSGKPTMKRMSTARSSVDGFQAEDVVMLSQIEDDRRSSVAATLDEEDRMSLPELSPPPSPVNAGFQTEDPVTRNSSLETDDNGEVRDSSTVAPGGDTATIPSTPTIDVHSPESLDDGSETYGSASSLSQDGPRQSLTVSTNPKHDIARSKLNSPRSPRLRHDTMVKEDSEKSTSAKSDVGDLSNALPTHLSKVAQSYRTNEWAKHLEAADKPDVDEISEPGSPGAQLEHEKPAPVSEGIAQPFAVAKRASKRVSSDGNVHRKNALMQINSNAARQSQSELPASRQPSTADLGRRVSSVPVQSPSKTLMGQRETLLRNRVSTQNFNQPISSVNELTATADEDMTLAQRRRVLKHQKPPLASQKWKKGSWAASPAVESFDSHQPKRTVGSGTDQKREELLAGWRGSIQQTGVPMQSAATREEQQRAAMMNAKRQKEMEQQQQAAVAHHRESMRHNMMRSSEMLDVHREAMRRMQSSANKKT